MRKCPYCGYPNQKHRTACYKCGCGLFATPPQQAVYLPETTQPPTAPGAITPDQPTPTEMKQGMTAAFVLLGLFLFCVVLLAHGCSNSQSTTSAREPTAIDAASLVEEYDANTVTADGKYKGKRLTVRGAVCRVTQDAYGNDYLQLVSTFGIDCYFDDNAELAALQPGDMVIVRGNCVGKALCSVDFEHCHIVTTEANSQ